MISSTVFYTLIVLHLMATTSAQWKPCLQASDDCYPINNITYPEKTKGTSEKGKLDMSISLWSYDENQVKFNLHAPPSDISDQSIGIAWSKDSSTVVFTCSIYVTTIIGPDYNVTSIDYNFHPKINGTAIYIKDKLYCSWFIEMNNNTFPYEFIDPPQYFISKSGYQITYNLTQTVSIAAANYSQLPEEFESFVDGYKYKALGSQKYMLIVRTTNNASDFLLKVNEETPKFVEVQLKSEIEMDIECNFEKQYVIGYIKYGKSKVSEWKLLKNTEIDENECRWSLPDEIDSYYGLLRPKQTINGLQIVENNRFVYFGENNFRLAPISASSSLRVAKSLLIVMILSVIFHNLI